VRWRKRLKRLERQRGDDKEWYSQRPAS